MKFKNPVSLYTIVSINYLLPWSVRVNRYFSVTYHLYLSLFFSHICPSVLHDALLQNLPLSDSMHTATASHSRYQLEQSSIPSVTIYKGCDKITSHILKYHLFDLVDIDKCQWHLHLSDFFRYHQLASVLGVVYTVRLLLEQFQD